MKRQLVLPACLLLLWALTAPVSCADEMTVSEVPDGIKLSCGESKIENKDGGTVDYILKYSDEFTGEYKCVPTNDDSNSDGQKIFVKFRTCDNCVEFDEVSIAGIAVGNLVLTAVIGVAVYLVTSQTSRIGPVSSKKKSSDRQHLVTHEVSSGSSRAPNDHYQPLKARQRDTYDVLARK
ncbi:T-cell surface glycoprotein CD3 delta chain-like isoform X2 [Centropristis striata]|uniref:T-cell surface glycoprotein CD3 delta chain-like isoform X2 n=1 Tax=Centropristis striata TaxID=184440 RepID=UPI0027E0E4A6|nr:T-cell surface glycoprotein CD3 delta chain-like isoform X2 [Centropristis striata]